MLPWLLPWSRSSNRCAGLPTWTSHSRTSLLLERITRSSCLIKLFTILTLVTAIILLEDCTIIIKHNPMAIGLSTCIVETVALGRLLGIICLGVDAGRIVMNHLLSMATHSHPWLIISTLRRLQISLTNSFISRLLHLQRFYKFFRCWLRIASGSSWLPSFTRHHTRFDLSLIQSVLRYLWNISLGRHLASLKWLTPCWDTVRRIFIIACLIWELVIVRNNWLVRFEVLTNALVNGTLA